MSEPGRISMADARRLADAMHRADTRPRPRSMLASTRAGLMSSANHYTPEPPRLGTRELRRVELMLGLYPNPAQARWNDNLHFMEGFVIHE